MKDLLALAPGIVETRTAAAFAPALSDGARINALAGVPGFRRGGAFTSVLLTAWDPSEFGVYDKTAGLKNWPNVVTPACVCNQRSLLVYFDHLRQIAGEMTTSTGMRWTPRNVDMALLNL